MMIASRECSLKITAKSLEKIVNRVYVSDSDRVISWEGRIVRLSV